MKKSDLKKYAKLIACVGANVQKNQEVLITAEVGSSYFVEYVVEECYKRKCKSVTVEWQNSNIAKLNYKYQKLATLETIKKYEIEKMEYRQETLPAVIHLVSEDPDALKGVDQTKLMGVRRTRGLAFKKYNDFMDNKYQWTIAALPSEAWAKKVFPELSTKKAVESLWEAILACARVNGDAIENWNEHNANFLTKRKILNDMGIKDLLYTSANGTNLKVSLHQNTHFEGGGSYTLGGVYYNPNMPTEECFTSPDKLSAEGTLYSAKPLSVMGNLVDNFGFVFKGGKIVEVVAQEESHKAFLEKLIATDEGAAYLGEVALVPFNSPVNETGLLFYNTLFDENACCHFAIGAAFPDVIDDYSNLTQEEIKAVGLNESVIHVDFMIGTADLSIKAITFDGQEVEIFKDGNWAI